MGSKGGKILNGMPAAHYTQTSNSRHHENHTPPPHSRSISSLLSSGTKSSRSCLNSSDLNQENCFFSLIFRSRPVCSSLSSVPNAGETSTSSSIASSVIVRNAVGLLIFSDPESWPVSRYPPSELWDNNLSSILTRSTGPVDNTTLTRICRSNFVT